MTSKLDSVLTEKAVKEIIRYEEKKQTEKGKQTLHSKPILAQIQLKNIIKKTVTRPVRVKIPNSLFNVDDEDDYSVCFFCKNEDKKIIDIYLTKNSIKGLTRVISMNEAKKLYSKSKDKKQLLTEHSHFICDIEVLKNLYKLLGNTFTDTSYCPVPITYKSPEKIEEGMIKIISSSYMHLKGRTIY